MATSFPTVTIPKEMVLSRSKQGPEQVRLLAGRVCCDGSLSTLRKPCSPAVIGTDMSNIDAEYKELCALYVGSLV